MVIQKFNKLIRNKWIWGAFAVAISAFFAFDFLVADIGRKDENKSDRAGTIGGEPVDLKKMEVFRQESSNFGKSHYDSETLDRMAREKYAENLVVEKNGLTVANDELKAWLSAIPAFRDQSGAFSYDQYKAILAQQGMTPEQFELNMRHQMEGGRIGAVLQGAAWASPNEREHVVACLSDEVTVRVASFELDKKEADAVTVDDYGWYTNNTESLKLPERVMVRYVRFDATNSPAYKAVTDADVAAFYDELTNAVVAANQSMESVADEYKKYVTETNDVSEAKPFDSIKAMIRLDLRKPRVEDALESYVESWTADLSGRRKTIDELAAAAGLSVVTSGYFAVSSFSALNKYQQKFLKSTGAYFRGARESEVLDEVSRLDPESPEYWFGIVTSTVGTGSGWIFERVDLQPEGYLPTFEEAKDVLHEYALADRQAEVFKQKVEAIAEQGPAAVLATEKVSTNIVIKAAQVGQLPPELAKFQNSLVAAAINLYPGDTRESVSEFTLPQGGSDRTHAILVVCTDRVQGDPADREKAAAQASGMVNGAEMQRLGQSWREWNLKRLQK